RTNVHTCRWCIYGFTDSPICEQRKPPFNLALNANCSAPIVDPSTIKKERAMNRLITWAVAGTLLIAAAGLMIANAQQSSAPAFMGGDRPVTAEQVREKLQSDGWSNVVVSRNGRYIEATGSLNGEAKWPSTRKRVAFGPPTTTMMIKPRMSPRPQRTRG